MRAAIVFDCEFLTSEGAPQRFWCGPSDPDPTVVQIGAVRLGLEGDAPILDTLDLIVTPRGRAGEVVALDPHFVRLTGITPKRVRSEGTSLADALARFEGFTGDARCWSWGKDELNLLAISCWVEGIAAPMRPDRFGNAAALLLEAGLPQKELDRVRSNTLADHLGVAHPPLRAHDALGDALSVAYSLQHLLRVGRLDPTTML